MRPVVKIMPLWRVLLLVLFIPAASFAEKWPKVDVESQISWYLSPEGGYAWVEAGKLDLGGDGDLDLLVNLGVDEPPNRSDTWKIYFKEDGDYYFSPHGGRLPIFRNNLEFRRVDEDREPKALVWYDSRPGNEGQVMAFWYRKKGNLSWEMRNIMSDEGSLLPPRKDEIYSSSKGESWESKGLSIEEVLKDYTKHRANPDR